jgi:phosphoribosylglycinamide formyltransferase-1
MKRVGVLISGNGSTLQALLDTNENSRAVVVISSHPKYGVLRAKRFGVPVEIIPEQLKGLSERLEAEKWIAEILLKYRVEKVFLAGFMKIVSPQFIAQFNSMFNIHPSLLPKYKGLDSLKEALNAGDKTAGVTVHQVVQEVDSGGFILQREFEIPQHRDSTLSHLWLHIQEQRVLRESLRKITWQIAT